MTAIAGFCESGKVWIGGDSAGVAGHSLTPRADKKVFINGEFLFGFTSSFRMGQILQYKFQPPKQHDQELFGFMVTAFVDGVRETLKSAGFAQKDKEQESGGTFLVGYRQRLFRIGDDYQVGESLAGYDACGCGQDIALGSLCSTRGMEPEKRIRLALEAAEKHSAGVREPFTVLSI